MNDFKVRGPTHPSPRATQGVERAEKAGGALDPRAAEEAAPAGEARSAAEPARLVEEIRAGRLDVDGAVEILIEQALTTPMVAEASEALRRQIRSVLGEMIQEDPTLADLASAMKR